MAAIIKTTWRTPAMRPRSLILTLVLVQAHQNPQLVHHISAQVFNVLRSSNVCTWFEVRLWWPVLHEVFAKRGRLLTANLCVSNASLCRTLLVCWSMLYLGIGISSGISMLRLMLRDALFRILSGDRPLSSPTDHTHDGVQYHCLVVSIDLNQSMC